jgi:protoporphyrinogen IX oxidase
LIQFYIFMIWESVFITDFSGKGLRKSREIPIPTGPTTSSLFFSNLLRKKREQENPGMNAMDEVLAGVYPWVKAGHVIAMIAWMAGLFYLPRLFVYHVEAVEAGSATDVMFQTMERRLLRAIMLPAMIVTWILGVALVMTPGIVDWTAIWPWTKAVSVLGMTWFHGWLGGRRKDFVAGRNRVSGRHYRMMNEVPTVLMVVIVLSVIVKF